MDGCVCVYIYAYNTYTLYRYNRIYHVCEFNGIKTFESIKWNRRAKIAFEWEKNVFCILNQFPNSISLCMNGASHIECVPKSVPPNYLIIDVIKNPIISLVLRYAVHAPHISNIFLSHIHAHTWMALDFVRHIMFYTFPSHTLLPSNRSIKLLDMH